jgi:tRNA 2-selenouridine synthase SelU
LETRKEKIISRFNAFKRASEDVKTKAQWDNYRFKAEDYINMIRNAGLDDYYRTALIYYDAACKRYE